MRKLNLIKVVCAIMFVAFAIQSCKSDDDDANYQMENQAFVTQALTTNKFEVAAGTLANMKSNNAQVKQLAGHIVTDHTATGTDLTDLAKSLELVVPANIDAQDQTNINILGLLTGTAFDKEFVRMMVESHEKAIPLFQQASGNTGVPAADLRRFADNKVPVLQQHLAEAKTLQASIK